MWAARSATAINPISFYGEVIGLRKTAYTYPRKDVRAMYLERPLRRRDLSMLQELCAQPSESNALDGAHHNVDGYQSKYSCTVSLCTRPWGGTVLSGPKKGFACQEDLRLFGDLPTADGFWPTALSTRESVGRCVSPPA